MSAIEGKEDPSTSAVGENIPQDKSTKPTDDAEKTVVGVTKKDENDSNLVSTDSGTSEKGNIVDTNLKFDTLAEGDQIYDINTPTGTESSNTSSVEVPSSSKAAIDNLQTISSDTNEQKTEKDDKILKPDYITSNLEINRLLSERSISKESSSNVDIDKTKEKTSKPINPIGNDNPLDDLNNSFDDDDELELKWEDDERDEDYSKNLSDEALKLLDKELGIEDKVANIETNIEIVDNIIKQSTDIDTTGLKVHKHTVEDTKNEKNKDIPVEVAQSVAKNIDTKIDKNTKTSPSINRSTDKGCTESELIEPNTISEVLNKEASVSSSNTSSDIVKEAEIVNKNTNLEEIYEQNQSELIRDKELTSSSNNDNAKDFHEPQKSSKLQITEDIIEMDIDSPNNSEILQNVEEMDVELSENAMKIELVNNPVELTKQSSIIEEKSQNKINEDIQEKIILTDCADIDMTEIADQSVQEIDSLEQVEDNPLSTEYKKDLSIKEVPIDDIGKVVTDDNVENSETQIPTTKLNEIDALAVTKGMKTDLGLNKPDVMLEIPTQELIDIDDFEDSIEMDKEIIDSEVSTSNIENNTSTLGNKSLLEETCGKNIKSTIEQQETTTQSQEKDITDTELVKIVSEKEESVETTEKNDKNNIKIDDKVDNFILSDDSATESNSIIKDDQIFGESSSKIDDDNAIKEHTLKTTDSNITKEPTSRSSDDSKTVPSTEGDESMTVESISDPNDDCMTEDQTSQINSDMTKETSYLNDNMSVEVSEENHSITENTSKADNDSMTEEISKLDQNMAYKPIFKPNDSNMTEGDDKRPKNTEEASKGNREMSKLKENTTAKLTSKVSVNSNMSSEPSKDKESSGDVTTTADPPKDIGSSDDVSISAESSKDKETSFDVSTTAELSKDIVSSNDASMTEELSKDKELSDDVSTTAELSEDKESSVDISTTAELSKDNESSVNISTTTELSKHKKSLDGVSTTAELTKDKESSNDVSATAEFSKDNKSSVVVSTTSEFSKDKESSDDVSTTAELSKDNLSTRTASKGDDDITEGPEMSDSLGLLAESSRVMEDEDQDEDDDSDDFEQDDESSNLQTAEHSEESNPPSEEAQPGDKDAAIPDESIIGDETIIYNEDPMAGIDIVDDIVCEETDIVEKVAATVEPNVESATLGNEIAQDESQVKEEESLEINKEDGGVLRDLLLKDNTQTEGDGSKKNPSKSTVLSISSTKEVNIMTYVDLEESSDDDIQEINKDKTEEIKEESDEVTEEKIVEENKPKTTLKMTKLNTSEVTIKTGVSSIPPLIIPEITNVSEIEKSKDIVPVESKHCLEEIYSLDSDSEEEGIKTPIEDVIQSKFNPKCINAMCTSTSTDQHYVADAAAMRHYGATRRRAVCAPCLASVDDRNEALIQGIKDLTPLLDLNMEKPSNQLVEISDSESDGENDLIKECNEYIGQEGAKMLNEKLADLINDAWTKFNMDDRLKDSENYINGKLITLEDESTEINKLLNECQAETDRIRSDLYKTFERSSKSLLPLTIHDTPTVNYTCLEKDDVHEEIHASPFLRSALEEPPAKRQNCGPTLTNTEIPPTTETAKQADDDRDVSVVLLSAEAAPDDLPPPGEVVRPPLRVGMQVHAMRNAFGSWLRGRILDIQPKVPGQQYTHCRVKFDHNVKNPCKVLPARCIAYQEPCSVRMTIGTRVLALFKDSNKKESFYSGVVAEIPNPVNTYRYLVFFDDGYAQYVKHKDTRLVCESKSTVWEEVHPFIRDFVKDYLMKYPERPMVRLHAGQRLNTEWNGKWWTSKVMQVDASLAHVHFEEDDRTEWIYRGSTRLAPLYLELQAAGRSRTRLPRSKAQFRTNMPYVEYMRSEEQSKQQQQLQQEEMIRRQRAVAKKSVTLPQPTPMVDKPDNVTSRVVYYTPKNAVKPYKMVPHVCGPQCRRTDVLSLKELRTYNPLAKPLLSGWERMQVRFKGSKHIMYRAPCGRRIRDMRELHRYLRSILSDLPVDLFDFNVNTHCLAEFVLHKYNVMKKDLSHGKESVPVPCVNYYDDSLPEFCSYNTERTPTAGVPLNLDPDFLCGCDCEDDCMDKTKCACWKMTLEGARTIGLDSPNVGYVYRRLPDPLPSGIYECNSRCKCKSTCLNRVAQHPLQLKLQVFKTLKRGWGIRALNDVPKGSFLCVYAGNLLTDATANLDGLNEGDEYLAELDYIEVVEQMKEGFEEDIPDADKKLDKKESKQPSSEEEETESEEDNRDSDKNDKEDGDFQPGYIGLGLTEFNKRLRKRGKKKQNEEQNNKENSTGEQKTGDCITISDDEEVREPSRFTAQAGMGDKGFISKYRSVRTLFGKDEACYIMDAKVQGNIGRYLNHSCCPNVFVQNVFVDTHDPRFPWVAFFALSHIRAGTELTWNYNYDIGSVPGKILYCYCGAHNCRGRLL